MRSPEPMLDATVVASCRLRQPRPSRKPRADAASVHRRRLRASSALSIYRRGFVCRAEPRCERRWRAGRSSSPSSSAAAAATASSVAANRPLSHTSRLCFVQISGRYLCRRALAHIHTNTGELLPSRRRRKFVPSLHLLFSSLSRLSSRRRRRAAKQCSRKTKRGFAWDSFAAAAFIISLEREKKRKSSSQKRAG